MVLQLVCYNRWMSTIFLTSNFFTVAPAIAKLLPPDLKNTRGLFITTAAEAEEGDKTWLNDDRQALQNLGVEVIDYTLTGKSIDDFSNDFSDVHVVLMSGGNVFYLLEKAQQSGFIPFIQNFVSIPGNIYIGSSAGAVITGPDIAPFSMLDQPSAAPNLRTTTGFCFTDLLLFVHWGSDSFKNSYLQAVSTLYQVSGKSILLTNQQFLYINDGATSIQEMTL